MEVAVRRVLVLDDEELIEALEQDEATEERVVEAQDGGSRVAYELRTWSNLDVRTACLAVGLEINSEPALADTGEAAVLWGPAEVEEALPHLNKMIRDPETLAESVCATVQSELQPKERADLHEVIDVLGQLDRGYEPGPTAHPAVLAAALVMRLVLAFRVAQREGAWVLAM